MVSFVWSEIGFDAGETPEHVIVRKEAERIAGAGEFWWVVGSPLGITVEAKAEQNGGTLPVLFSKSRSTEQRESRQVRIWDTWRSLLHPQKHGRIPDHVIVTSGHDLGKKLARYALICRSDAKLSLRAVGFCDLAQCRSLKSAGRVKSLRGTHVLRKGEPLISRQGTNSESVYSVVLRATLVGHSYVLLENSRVLTQDELSSLQQFKAGHDWSSLVKKLRQRG